MKNEIELHRDTSFIVLYYAHTFEVWMELLSRWCEIYQNFKKPNFEAKDSKT